MEAIDKLKGSRKAYRSHLTRIWGKLEELSLTLPATDETTTAVTSYIDQIQRKSESIQQLDSRIQSTIAEPSDIERDVLESLEIQDTIIENMTRLKRFLEKANTTVTTTVTSSTPPITDEVARPSVASRLPKLDLPRYSGDPLGWQTFWDSFKAAVHSNSNLTGVEKFNYLRAQLDGEASRTVSGLTLTDANYEQSVSILKSRFGKKQRIINAHMQALLELPTPSNSAASLRQLYDTIESHIRGLQSLGKTKETFGDFLIPIVFGKLPSVVRRNLTRDHTSDEWNIDELLSAIEKEITVLESGLERQGDSVRSTVMGSFHTGVRRGQSVQQFGDKKMVSSKPSCIYCKGPHSSAQCNVVTDVKARLDVVKRERLCYNCLGNHKSVHCNSKNRCRICHKKHHSSLCGMDTTSDISVPQSGLPRTPQSTQPVQSTAQPAQAPQNTLNPASNSFVPTQSVGSHTTITQFFLDAKRCPQYLLKTAIAFVRVGNTRVSANILFDEGAQRSFVTEALAAQLGANPHHTECLSISSFGGSTAIKNTVKLINVTLETHTGDVKLSALVVPKIATPIQNFVTSDLQNLSYLRSLKLAHPISTIEQFHISLLIGVDQYWQIVGNHIVRGEGPTAMESKLGYLLSGPLPLKSALQPVPLHTYGIQTIDLELSDCPESLPNSSPSTPTLSQQNAGTSQSSQSFMHSYQRDCIMRDKDGSYVVRFPWKENHPFLPSNFVTCDRQTRALARRLARQPNLLQLYGNLIAEQEQRNFIERAPNPNSNGMHYIPHHPVKKNSSTTPIRIVYNCSCRQSPKHASLNDCLMTGDPALTDLCAIILRFRLHCYALSTDIEKAFLHVKLADQDRDFTRFLWLTNPIDPESPFVIYRFRAVLFGSVSSPFMLSATLDHHLNLYNSPVARDMKSNLYVDNIISGCQSEQHILHYYAESRAIMSDAKFNLRSWASNSLKLTEQAQRDHVLDSSTTVNLLGLKWNTCTDTLSLTQCQIKRDSTSPMTKRSVLQTSSKQYDPLGWLSPITIRAKLLIQELWKQQVGWDDPLDEQFNLRWSQVAADIEEGAKVMMTRRYSVMSTKQCIYLHVFADASTKAYGAVAYLQSANQVDFVLAKSCVSPLKDTTLPRLELRAAVTAAHLAKFIVSTINVPVTVKLWSDSQIVLHWIFSSKQLKPFVANRVKVICSLFPASTWGYCQTKDNAADLLTRGITPAQLQTSSLWVHGPEWITSEIDWPKWSPMSVLNVACVDEEIETTTLMVKANVIATSGVHQVIDINNFSKLTRLLRVTAYVLRFVNNLRKLPQQSNGPLTAVELFLAQKLWIKSAQLENFPTEITHLKSKSSSRPPLVRQLRLYLDKEGIICCGGRIHNAPVSQSTKFPYLLPKKHKLTKLIVRYTHEKHFHSGANSTVTYIRQRYWIPAARQCVRSILKQCVICNKLCGNHYKTPDPPPLPQHRVQAMEPFTVTGIDFTGALYTRTPNGESKVYVCLFTCASTRAVHLEVVTDLSEETFLQAFRRFSSRKSLPRLVVSDNASTFMAAADELKALFESNRVKESLGNQGVDWKFIPCRAPWYGGYWERLVGLTKNALKKTLGRAYVTLPSLQTLIVEIEAHLNNRPLTYVSSELNEPEPLTPSHLLYGRVINTVPHPLTTQDELTDMNFQEAGSQLHRTLSKKAKAQALLIQHFWSRWRREYLTSLRETHTTSGESNKETIKVGDVVIVHDDCPRLKWRLAVVQELQRGNDNFVRSAVIRTDKGITNRPISKLYPLEVNVGKTVQNSESENATDNNSHTSNTPLPQSNDHESQSSLRPQRIAATKARTKVTEWNMILRGPEDVTD